MIPRVSVIICTCNRAESLRMTLASIMQCSVPSDLPTEVIVVDNHSTDHTRRVVEDCRSTDVPMRYVLEERKGKGFAYNAGLAAAMGEVMLFTDDDVRVPQDWIEGMCRPIIEGRADAIAGGVKLAPHLYVGLHLHPAWLAATEGMDADRPERAVGANMAFGRWVLAKVKGFDPELGPGRLGFADETLFIKQLLAAGYTLRACLEVTVEHHCDQSRLTREGTLAIAARAGQSDAYVDYHWRHIEHQFSTTYFWKATLGLWAHRLRHARNCFLKRRTTDWEIDRVMHIAYMRQLADERCRPRNYERLGLTKICGLS